MPRTYANVVTAIWDNEAFRQLDDVDQRTYLMLVSQSDISAAGVLAFRVRRWSRYARNTTVESISGSLARLADARFIVIDAEHEELLVRSFVRHDKGYSNPKRRPAILTASQEVRSPIVRLALASELHRLGLPTGELADALADSHTDSHPDSLSDPRDDRSIEDGLNTQANSLSDSHTDSVSPEEGVVVIQGPYLGTPNPQPPTPNPAANAAPEEERTPEGETALVDAVRAVRAEWTPRSIRRAIEHPDVLARPWPLVQLAMLAVAGDATSQTPGRLPHDGPWWRVGPPPRPAAEPCRTHRGYPAHNCGLCRSEALGGTT